MNLNTIEKYRILMKLSAPLDIDKSQRFGKVSWMNHKVSFVQIIWIIMASLTVFAAALPTIDSQADERSVLLLGNESRPPMCFMKDGKPSGLIVDLAEALSKHMHHPVEIGLMNWTKAQDLVLEGQADALLQINPSPERLELYDFSEPLLNSEFMIFTSSNRIGIQSMRHLRGLKVGVEENGLPSLLLKKDPQIIVQIIPDYLQGFKNAEGRCH